MAKRSTFVGLDVHKDSIAVAIAEAGRLGEVRTFGEIWARSRPSIGSYDRWAPLTACCSLSMKPARVGSRSSGTCRRVVKTVRS